MLEHTTAYAVAHYCRSEILHLYLQVRTLNTGRWLWRESLSESGSEGNQGGAVNGLWSSTIFCDSCFIIIVSNVNAFKFVWVHNGPIRINENISENSNNRCHSSTVFTLRRTSCMVTALPPGTLRTRKTHGLTSYFVFLKLCIHLLPIVKWQQYSKSDLH